MAGDWIQMRVLLPSDPKTIAMADRLSTAREFMHWLTDPVRATCKECAYEHVTPYVTQCVTVTGLLRVWGVARDRGKRDGERDIRLSFCSLATLDDISGVPGFGDAMAYVGWAIEGDNCVIFPNLGVDTKTAEEGKEEHKRKLARERKRRQRERDGERDIDNVTGRDLSRQEKSIEEKKVPTALETENSTPTEGYRGGSLSEGRKAMLDLEADTPENRWLKQFMGHRPGVGHPLGNLSNTDMADARLRVSDLIEAHGESKAGELLRRVFSKPPRPVSVIQATLLIRKTVEANPEPEPRILQDSDKRYVRLGQGPVE